MFWDTRVLAIFQEMAFNPCQKINHNLMRASDRRQKPQFICQGSLNHPKQLQTHQVWITHGLWECQWCHLFEMIHTCVRHEIHITIQVYVLKLSFQAFGIYSLHRGLSQFCPPQGFLGMPLCLCTVFRINLNIWQKRKVTSDTCMSWEENVPNYFSRMKFECTV